MKKLEDILWGVLEFLGFLVAIFGLFALVVASIRLIIVLIVGGTFAPTN